VHKTVASARFVMQPEFDGFAFFSMKVSIMYRGLESLRFTVIIVVLAVAKVLATVGIAGKC
jgi:hypothetical protein